MKAAPITYLDRLCLLPEQRSIPWREGQELPPEKSIDSHRVQQRGACVLATRGKIAEKPCDHCAAGNGRFRYCITLDKWFQGACSSCIFTSKGNKCSLRVQGLGSADGRALRHKINMDGTPVSDEKLASRKRRRRSEPAKRTSMNKVLFPSEPPAFQTPPAKSSDVDRLLEAQLASGMMDQPPIMEKKQSQRYSLNVPPTQISASGVAPTWAPISTQQTYAPPPREETWHQNIKDSQPLRPDRATYLDRSDNSGGPPPPIIDTLPKSKQRQIFGLVSGIQGGIDNLQKQLNLLRESLGVEFEEAPSVNSGQKGAGRTYFP